MIVVLKRKQKCKFYAKRTDGGAIELFEMKIRQLFFTTERLSDFNPPFVSGKNSLMYIKPFEPL
jgi:hypothetical protein